VAGLLLELVAYLLQGAAKVCGHGHPEGLARKALAGN
jgi:hypothetical protein